MDGQANRARTLRRMAWGQAQWTQLVWEATRRLDQRAKQGLESTAAQELWAAEAQKQEQGSTRHLSENQEQGNQEQ